MYDKDIKYMEIKTIKKIKQLVSNMKQSHKQAQKAVEMIRNYINNTFYASASETLYKNN